MGHPWGTWDPYLLNRNLGPHNFCVSYMTLYLFWRISKTFGWLRLLSPYRCIATVLGENFWYKAVFWHDPYLMKICIFEASYKHASLCRTEGILCPVGRIFKSSLQEAKMCYYCETLYAPNVFSFCMPVAAGPSILLREIELQKRPPKKFHGHFIFECSHIWVV